MLIRISPIAGYFVRTLQQLKLFENLITYRGNNVSYHFIISPFLARYPNMNHSDVDSSTCQLTVFQVGTFRSLGVTVIFISQFIQAMLEL
jgi:hypothetical protein